MFPEISIAEDFAGCGKKGCMRASFDPGMRKGKKSDVDLIGFAARLKACPVPRPSRLNPCMSKIEIHLQKNIAGRSQALKRA